MNTANGDGRFLERQDYATIGEIIEPGSRVLDLGCGDGALLAFLMHEKNVDARGVEIDRNLVQQAIARGASVYQGDLAQSLADYPDGAFDYVILSQTLQQVARPRVILNEMLRVGRKMIVGFPNFGYWRIRAQYLLGGRAPKSRMFPYEWFDSPNIHVLTVEDFEALAAEEKWRIEQRIFLAGRRRVSLLGNLRAEVAVYVAQGARGATGGAKP
jgi:methionine biosynthesis protein MetW